MEHTLCRSDPIGDELCGREECLICLTSKKERGVCRKRNIVYKTTCNLCKSLGRSVNYWGESSRSGFERGREHRQDLMKQNPDSHLLRHMVREHSEIDLNEADNRRAEKYFSMELVGQHRTAMDRQLSEALAIAKAGGMDHPDNMNNSDEYNRCLLPELQTTAEIKMKLREREKRAREEDREGRPVKRRREASNPFPQDPQLLPEAQVPLEAQVPQESQVPQSVQVPQVLPGA